MESSVCAECPAGAESLSAWNNLPARKRFPARARLPALWQLLRWGLEFRRLLLLLTVLRESYV